MNLSTILQVNDIILLKEERQKLTQGTWNNSVWPIQLTLEQHRSELHWSTCMGIFSVNTSPIFFEICNKLKTAQMNGIAQNYPKHQSKGMPQMHKIYRYTYHIQTMCQLAVCIIGKALWNLRAVVSQKEHGVIQWLATRNPGNAFQYLVLFLCLIFIVLPSNCLCYSVYMSG